MKQSNRKESVINGKNVLRTVALASSCLVVAAMLVQEIFDILQVVTGDEDARIAACADVHSGEFRITPILDEMMSCDKSGRTASCTSTRSSSPHPTSFKP